MIVEHKDTALYGDSPSCMVNADVELMVTFTGAERVTAVVIPTFLSWVLVAVELEFEYSTTRDQSSHLKHSERLMTAPHMD